MSGVPYRARGRTKRSANTRAKILQATHELLDEGRFHETSVEDVAERAGLSRATVYQYFPSRLDLVDAICERFGENPALLSVRASVVLDDPDHALDRTIADATRFWSSEDSILRQLYGATAIDPAARDLVERQGSDRRTQMQRLARRLHDRDRLRSGIDRGAALAHLLVLTSYGTYRELREAGLSEPRIVEFLQTSARRLLFP